MPQPEINTFDTMKILLSLGRSDIINIGTTKNTIDLLLELRSVHSKWKL